MDEDRALRSLVVDDDPTGRAFLRALLRKTGYEVEVAASGEEALARFAPEKYDAIFMDVRMPGIDGIETTRRIKALAAGRFTPVIFVTGAGDEDSLVRAIDAGGDDFLVKPVTPAILLAKLCAMQRIRAVHEHTRTLLARMQEDQQQAHEVFDRAVLGKVHQSPALRSRLIAADVFSGDLLLSALSPRGRLHVLVGDFTGHGLAAALGAMPVADTFHAMVAGEAAPEAILDQLNGRLMDALPRGHFLAACLASVAPDLATLTVANCGLPPLLLYGPDGLRERIASASFALGIVKDAGFGAAFRTFSLTCGERLVIASDGVSETVNRDGDFFGEPRLEAALADHASRGDNAPATVLAALDSFRAGTPFADDVSIVEIIFIPALFASTTGSRATSVREELST